MSGGNFLTPEAILREIFAQGPATNSERLLADFMQAARIASDQGKRVRSVLEGVMDEAISRRRDRNRNLMWTVGWFVGIASLGGLMMTVTTADARTALSVLQIACWIGFLVSLVRAARDWFRTPGIGEAMKRLGVYTYSSAQNRGYKFALISLIACAVVVVGYFVFMSRYQYFDGPLGMNYRIDKWTGTKEWYNPRSKTWEN